MKAKWKEIIRNKLEGHRQPPPDGLWEGISDQMGLQPETVRHPASDQKENSSRTALAYLRRWPAAAAAAILVIGGFFAYYQQDKTESSSPVAISDVQMESMPLQETEALLPEVIAAEFPKKSAIPSVLATVSNPQPTPTENVPRHDEQSNVKPEGSDMESNEADRNEGNLPSSTPPSEPKQEINSDITPPSTSDNQKNEKQEKTGYPTHTFEPVHRHSSRPGKWTWGLHASGGLLAAKSNTHSVENAYFAMDGFFNSAESANKIGGFIAQSYETHESKHHLPVRFGMSLNHPLSDRLSLLSGINYTWLYSEYNNGSAKREQHLHYLGLPVGVAYRLWSSRHLQFYISGSVMLEKCINEKPWQWSVDAGAGAEYTLTRQWGLYIEPSVGYYFDDGTSFEQYYKEHPIAPNIMVGVRMHINQ